MTGAEHHRLQVDAILVDQPATRKGRGEVGAADHHVAARLLLQPLHVLGYDLAHDGRVPVRLLQRARVDEFGPARQMRANSRSCAVADGSSSACGQ